MRRPTELERNDPPWDGASTPSDIWGALEGSASGDVARLRTLVEGDERLVRCDFEGTRPLHLAVREGHEDAVRFLVEAGADALDVSVRGDDLVTVARDRGYDAVTEVLERAGAEARSRPDVEERWRASFTELDLLLWSGPFWNVRGELDAARSLAGEAPGIVIAAALGDEERVRALLTEDESQANRERANGKRALSAAIEFGHDAIARLLLERGADPNLPEGEMAPRGSALHAAARLGNAGLVEALLDYGADPNAFIDSSGSATYAAATPELRTRLIAAGGRLTPFDLVWLGEDDEVVAAVTRDPSSAHAGCGSVFAAICTLEKRELLERVLQAGAELPREVNGCRSYLLEHPDMLARLLASGMSPDLPSWQGATLLHETCVRDRRGRARPERIACAQLLVEAGANLEARDDDLRSRPLAWAARAGLPDMVQWLLAQGALVNDEADDPWARPVAWAERRGHAEVVGVLGG